MVRLTDRPDMTTAVYRGRKTTAQQQQQLQQKSNNKKKKHQFSCLYKNKHITIPSCYFIAI